MQQVARLALKHLAQPRERGEADRARVVVLEDGQVGVRQADAAGELSQGHLALGQDLIQPDFDRVRFLAHTV
jgi:hypothetical protein